MDERVATLVRQGQQALQRGSPDRAKEYLAAALDLDPDNTTALLWISGVQADPHEARRSLERVLELEPDNLRAQQGLMQLQARLGEALPPNEDEWGEADDTIITVPPPRRGTGTLSIEQELRAALRVSEVDTASGAGEFAAEAEQAERGGVRSFLQGKGDDMPYRIAVATLALLLVVGAVFLLLLLIGVGPFVPRV